MAHSGTQSVSIVNLTGEVTLRITLPESRPDHEYLIEATVLQLLADGEVVYATGAGTFRPENFGDPLELTIYVDKAEKDEQFLPASHEKEPKDFAAGNLYAVVKVGFTWTTKLVYPGPDLTSEPLLWTNDDPLAQPVLRSGTTS